MAFLSEAISHFLRGLIVSCRKDEGFIAELCYVEVLLATSYQVDKILYIAASKRIEFSSQLQRFAKKISLFEIV